MSCLVVRCGKCSFASPCIVPHPSVFSVFPSISSRRDPLRHHPLLDDWGGDHWLPQIGPRVPLAMVSVLLTWSGGVISSDYCQFVIYIYIYIYIYMSVRKCLVQDRAHLMQVLSRWPLCIWNTGCCSARHFEESLFR